MWVAARDVFSSELGFDWGDPLSASPKGQDPFDDACGFILRDLVVGGHRHGTPRPCAAADHFRRQR